MSTGPTTPQGGEILPLAALERYGAGTATLGERARVEAWFMAYPVAMGWERLPPAEIARRAQEIVRQERPQRLRVTTRVRTHMWGVLRSVVVGVVAGAVLFVAAWLLGGRARHTAVTYTAYVTANGQRATIMLADGNTVVLNVASRLKVPTDYGAGNHMVQLQMGEALFVVSHHARAPFTVVTGHTTTRVLGTSFVVRHYPTDTMTTVAVRDGKVAVGTAVVTARQLAEIGRSGVPQVRQANPSQFAFATGVIMLPRMPLARAIPELNRWYAADIRLGDSSFAQVPIKGSFTAGSLSDLTSILELMLNARVVRDGRVLTLYPRTGK